MAEHDPKKWRPDFNRYIGRGYVSKKLFSIKFNKYKECMEVMFMLTQKSPYGGLQYLHCKLSDNAAKYWSERIKPGMPVLVHGQLFYEKKKKKNRRWQVKVHSLNVLDVKLHRRTPDEMEDIQDDMYEDEIMIIDTSHERKF